MKPENDLTICAITGNCEKYIDRWLDWALKLTPNVVVVSAIGNQVSDRTMEIACERGCSIATYYNKRGDWPHVDSFASARNLSFSMAITEWIMWADMDDLLDDDSIAAIHNCLQYIAPEVDAIAMPYEVPEDGLTVTRERIIRRSAGAAWKSPIHEFLDFPNQANIATLTTAKVLHAPIGDRKANDERNLRILESIPREELSCSNRFHLFQSLRAVGRLEDALAECISILTNPPAEIGKPEIYELYIAAGQLSPSVEVRYDLMTRAMQADPTRREAWGEMALCAIGLLRFEDALAYTTAMRALPRAESTWNARRKYYGYLGEHLHGMALRGLGRYHEADVTESNWFARHGAKISLIHATRGRTKQAVAARRNWFEKAKNPDAIEHIFGLDADEEESKFLTLNNHAMVSGKGGPVAAWNAAATKSTGAVLVQMSDDWEPPLHWDKLILDAIGDTDAPKVLAISDGARADNLLCMAILTRSRYRQQGFMFHPAFFSMYSDDWFTHKAWVDEVVIPARHIVFEHLHPAFGKAEMDATYARSNDPARYHQGAEILNKLKENQPR